MSNMNLLWVQKSAKPYPYEFFQGLQNPIIMGTILLKENIAFPGHIHGQPECGRTHPLYIVSFGVRCPTNWRFWCPKRSFDLVFWDLDYTCILLSLFFTARTMASNPSWWRFIHYYCVVADFDRYNKKSVKSRKCSVSFDKNLTPSSD